MRGREDNEVGVVGPARCCGKALADCRCAWEARKKVLRQQIMGGNNGPAPQPAPHLPRPSGRRFYGHGNTHQQ